LPTPITAACKEAGTKQGKPCPVLCAIAPVRDLLNDVEEIQERL